MCLKALKEMDKKSKAINILSFLTIGVAFLYILLFLYWSLYNYKPMVINKRPLNVLTKEVRQGGTLQFELDYCKYTDLPVTIRRRFVDGIIYAMPDVSANNKEGCRVQRIAVDIPENLPDGEYIFSLSYVYKVNPIRSVEVTTHTEKFEVIK